MNDWKKMISIKMMRRKDRKGRIEEIIWWKIVDYRRMKGMKENIIRKK